jgi:hypothetical protein
MSPRIGATETPSTADRDRGSHSRTALNGPQRRPSATALRSYDTVARMKSYWRNQPPSLCKENGRFLYEH